MRAVYVTKTATHVVTEEEFKHRTRQFGIRVLRLVRTLPRSTEGAVVGRQLLRCGTSVGANYRAACRGKSVADVLAKLAIVEEEIDETLYWLEIIVECDLVRKDRIQDLMNEADQILAMTVASIKTLRRRIHSNPKSKI